MDVLKQQIEQIVKRSKLSDGGFEYICDLCTFDCLGRKGIIKHMKEHHKDEISKIQEEYEKEERKDFESQISKLVMRAPFFVKEAKITVDEARIEYPLTLDFMKIIDSRTTRIPRYGGLMGRLARLLAMIISKETNAENEVKLYCVKCKIVIGKICDLYKHLEKSHADFLQNLNTMFPPVKQRMQQFIEQAAKTFDLTVPTGTEVEVLQLVDNECNTKYSNQMKEFSPKSWPQVSKADENIVSLEETQRRKKEILLIESNLNDSSISDVRKNRLRKRLEELQIKTKMNTRMKKDVELNLKMKSYLDKMNPDQLRKLCMDYFDNFNDIRTICWKKVCYNANLEEDPVFLMGFMEALYNLAKFKEGQSFKIGNILVTSKQSTIIKEKGIRSYRDFVKKQSWRIPSSWELTTPGDLCLDWTREDDSQLMIGASRLGKNLAKIINSDAKLKTKALENHGLVLDSVKRRFAYLLNIYQNRGVFSNYFDLELYNEDIEEEENFNEETDSESEEGEID